MSPGLSASEIDRDRSTLIVACRPLGFIAPIVPEANLNVSPSPELMMYSNAAETRPRSSVASAESAIRPVGVRSTLSCAGATSTTDGSSSTIGSMAMMRWKLAVGETNGDGLCRDVKFDRPLVARLSRGDRVGTDVRDDPSGVAATAHRDDTSDERSNVARLVDSSRFHAAVSRRDDVGGERRQATRIRSAARTRPRSTESPACGERMRATAPPGRTSNTIIATAATAIGVRSARDRSAQRRRPPRSALVRRRTRHPRFRPR